MTPEQTKCIEQMQALSQHVQKWILTVHPRPSFYDKEGEFVFILGDGLLDCVLRCEHEGHFTFLPDGNHGMFGRTLSKTSYEPTALEAVFEKFVRKTQQSFIDELRLAGGKVHWENVDMFGTE